MRQLPASVVSAVVILLISPASVPAQGICEPPLPDPPPEVCSLDDGLIFLEAIDEQTFLWQQETGFDRFNLYRGRRQDLVDADHDGALDTNGSCVQNGTTGLSYSDFVVPATGDAFLYLVTGVGPAGESDLGMASSGVVRPNVAPCGGFGHAPAIESVTLVSDTDDRSAVCDMTLYFQGLLCGSGIRSSMLAQVPTLSLSVTYSGARLEALVTDPDSVPGHEDILLVASEFPTSDPEGPDPMRRSIALLDDGATGTTSFDQVSATGPEACGGDPDCPTCVAATYPLTSGDGTAGDRLSTRSLALVTPTGALEGMPGVGAQGHYGLALDCIAASRGREPIRIQQPAGTGIPLKVEAVDRAGNLSVWPDQPRLTLEEPRFSCQGDACSCCLLLSDDPGAECGDRPGLVGVPGSGFENGFCVDVF